MNKKGGLDVGGKKLPVQLILLDDTSTQATAVSLADRLVNSDKVDFLLGTYSSHLVEAQSTVAEQNRVPYVNGGGGATKIYKRKFKYVFGLISPVELLGTTLMQWVDEQQKAGKLPRPAKIALVWENTAHGKDFRKGVSDFAAEERRRVPDRGGRVVRAERQGLRRAPRQGEGGERGPVPRRRAPPGLHHDAPPVRGQRHVPQGRELRRARQREGRGQGARPGARELRPLRRVVERSARGASPARRRSSWRRSRRSTAAASRSGSRRSGTRRARALFTAIQQAGKVDREAVREKLAAMKMPSLLPGGTVEFKAEFGQQVQNPFVVQQNQPDGTSPIIYPKDVASAPGVAANPRCAK